LAAVVAVPAATAEILERVVLAAAQAVQLQELLGQQGLLGKGTRAAIQLYPVVALLAAAAQAP
jgi:hypothetical protein